MQSSSVQCLTWCPRTAALADLVMTHTLTPQALIKTEISGGLSYPLTLMFVLRQVKAAGDFYSYYHLISHCFLRGFLWLKKNTGCFVYNEKDCNYSAPMMPTDIYFLTTMIIIDFSINCMVYKM